MARVFKAQTKKAKQRKLALSIDALDQHGIGVCLSTKPITLVEGALPEEQVEVLIEQSSKQVQRAKLLKVNQANALRQEAFCQHYYACGGCKLQHISKENGLNLKMQALQKRMHHSLGVSEALWEEPLRSERAYRRKVRLAIDARDKANVKIGFRAGKSNKVIDIQECPILTEGLQAILSPLLQALRKIKSVKSIGHVTLLDSDSNLVVSLHCVKSINNKDLASLENLAQKLGFSLEVLHSENKQEQQILSIIKGFDSQELQISTQDFVQVNAGVNQQMLVRAIEWLSPSADDTLYDFFSGAGNFSLAAASRVKKVHSYEVIKQMCERAQSNAQMNGLSNIESHALNLDDEKVLQNIDIEKDALIILDPARAGANALSKHLSKSKARKILYVSCNANTMMRDMEAMKDNYTIKRIAVLDMFPFTEHMEVMALLER